MVGFEIPDGSSSDDHPEGVKGWVLWLSTFLVLVSLANYTKIFFAIPPFRELFEGFGADLPGLTRFVLDYGRYSIAFFPLGLIPLLAMWRRRLSSSPQAGKEFRWVIASFVISVFALGVTLFGIYLPVYKLGAVVS